jgi:hypothetical protein
MDRVRSDWAQVASLAEVHEQDLPPSKRRVSKAADRLWSEIHALRVQNAELTGEVAALREAVVSADALCSRGCLPPSVAGGQGG